MSVQPERSGIYETIGERIDLLRGGDFTGRSFELGFYEDYLTRLSERMERILNVHGIGGMGKTFLLERFKAAAAEREAMYVHIDLRRAAGSAGLIVSAICEQTAAWMSSPSGQASVPDAADIPLTEDSASPSSAEQAAAALNPIAISRRIVLAFDHYEEIGILDAWLRESLLPLLHTNILIVIAGRYPLEGPWTMSPAWRKLIVSLPVSEWSYDETKLFLRHCGITDDNAVDRLWMQTLGHPLSLSMAASASASGRLAAPPSVSLPEQLDARFEELVRHWLREAEDDGLRDLIMAASVPRTFHQESLSNLMEQGVSPSLFERLVCLSFVEKSDNGWRMHELVRETVRKSFRDRFPDRFELYRRRTVLSLQSRISEALEGGRDLSRETAELLSHTGNPILRAHFRHSRASRNYWETVGPHNAGEAEAYIRSRQCNARDYTIRCSDPETGELFRYSLTAEQSLLPLSLVSVAELVAHGGERAVNLLRSPEGAVVGLVVLLPIHEATLPFLMSIPVSAPYFRSLPPPVLESFRVPRQACSEWFLYCADVVDPEQEQLRADIVQLKLAHILSGSLIVTSPPALPYYEEAQYSLGFTAATGAEHTDYDGTTVTPTYVVDTRGGGMISFLNRVAEFSDDETEVRQSPAAAVSNVMEQEQLQAKRTDAAGGYEAPRLTSREQEVAGLLILGHTNAEIASALYMSVAAVKKHVNAMLYKYGMKNRTQLTKAMLDPVDSRQTPRVQVPPFSPDK